LLWSVSAEQHEQHDDKDEEEEWRDGVTRDAVLGCAFTATQDQQARHC
jgi:hypothetical protein